MKISSDLHRMEALFRSVKVPYTRGAQHVTYDDNKPVCRREPTLTIAGTVFVFHPDGSLKQTKVNADPQFSELPRLG